MNQEPLSVYRVHTVVKEREVTQTKWDIVIARDCENAIALVRDAYQQPNVAIKRIYSVNHMGDVTLADGYRIQ